MYFWLKAFHIIFMVAWMAGLLVYPRYKLHQLSGEPGGELFEAMKSASATLRRVVMTPSMIIVWILGLGLASINYSIFSFGWIWVKLLLVVAVTALHGYYIKMGKAIDAGEATVKPKTLKLLNELPFVALIIIVILVVVKPF